MNKVVTDAIASYKTKVSNHLRDSQSALTPCLDPFIYESQVWEYKYDSHRTLVKPINEVCFRMHYMYLKTMPPRKYLEYVVSNNSITDLVNNDVISPFLIFVNKKMVPWNMISIILSHETYFVLCRTEDPVWQNEFKDVQSVDVMHLPDSCKYVTGLTPKNSEVIMGFDNYGYCKYNYRYASIRIASTSEYMKHHWSATSGISSNFSSYPLFDLDKSVKSFPNNYIIFQNYNENGYILNTDIERYFNGTLRSNRGDHREEYVSFIFRDTRTAPNQDNIARVNQEYLWRSYYVEYMYNGKTIPSYIRDLISNDNEFSFEMDYKKDYNTNVLESIDYITKYNALLFEDAYLKNHRNLYIEQYDGQQVLDELTKDGTWNIPCRHGNFSEERIVMLVNGLLYEYNHMIRYTNQSYCVIPIQNIEPTDRVELFRFTEVNNNVYNIVVNEDDDYQEYDENYINDNIILFSKIPPTDDYTFPEDGIQHFPVDYKLERNPTGSWVENNSSFDSTLESVTYGEGKFVLACYNKIVYSTDGINWVETTIPSSITRLDFITYGNGRFVATGYSTKAIYSNDGINWTSTSLPYSKWWRSVAYGNGRFVAISYDDNKVAYSTDGGETWKGTTISFDDKWNTITYGKGKFVAISKTNKVAYSVDGINWTESTFPCDHCWKITYGNGKFVTATYGGNKVAYSVDGINWTESTLPFSLNWGVYYGGGKFVAVGYSSNKLAYSVDGINWTSATMPSTNYWCSFAYGNGRFVAVSNNNNNKNKSIAYSIPDDKQVKIVLSDSKYYGQPLTLTYKYIFRHKWYTIDENTADSGTYHIDLGDDFMYCFDYSKFLVFYNGRRLGTDQYRLCLPVRSTTPFSRFEIFLTALVEKGDRIDIIYTSSLMKDVELKDSISSNGIIEVDKNNITYPLSKNTYMVWVNGKKIPSDHVATVDSTHLRITEDIDSTKTVCITKFLYDIDELVKSFKDNDPLWDQIFAKLTKTQIDSLLELTNINITDKEPWIYENNISVKAVMYELIREKFIMNANVDTTKPLAYGYTDVDNTIITTTDSGGNALLEANDANISGNIDDVVRPWP